MTDCNHRQPLKKKLILPIFWGSAVMLLATGSVANESLLDIYALAKANDHQFKSDYAEYLANTESENISRAALLPQINGTASSRFSNADSRGTTPQETDTDTNSLTVSLSQTILDRNAWHTYEQGKITAEAAINPPRR